jgi:hypothetical protein
MVAGVLTAVGLLGLALRSASSAARTVDQVDLDHLEEEPVAG